MARNTGIKLGNCYQVESYLGEGGFGYVSKCRNTETGKMVAIKVNKNHPNVVRQTRGEIAILKKLQSLDPDTCSIVKWNGFFFHQDNICLNFELMDQSLREYMESRNDCGLPLTELRPIVQQLTTALYHLSSIGIVHADLKPDNIMVVDRMQQPLRVKVIDFGLARPVSACRPGVCLQTSWYRAPEIILHIPFNEGIDMWSLGLTATELIAGAPLYPANEDYDMLNFIIETQGQPADDVLDRGQGTELYFNKQNNSQQRWKFKTPEEFAHQTGYYGQDTRGFRVRSLDDLGLLMAMRGEDPIDQWLLVDLIKRMLELDPDRRIKPLEVLQHPFFSDSLSQSSSADSLDTICSEEDKPEVSEQFYSHGTEGPENVDYSVESCVDSYMEITDNAEETTEVTQQSSRNQTAGPENTDCNDDVSYYKTTKKRKRGENTVPEITQQSSLIQTAGPEDTDCNDDVSYYKTTKKRKTGENTVPEVTQQSSQNQTAGPEKIPEISPADILNTVESEEATPVLVNSENSDSSSEMSSGDMSLNMATGINLGECYRVESYLGEGSFGFVSKCCNTETGKMVAIKVNKNHPNVVHQTRGEIAILKKLQCLDPDACNIIKWNGYFFNEDQICLSFELLDMSLQNYMADTYTHSLPMTELRPIIHQLATALSHLRSTGIVHADLKPDNVMIVDRTQQPLRVRLIDFGQARPASAFKRGECVQARWYRAPEVILGLPLNETIDMWALGLLVAEMATGDPLYPGNENYDVLHFIVKTQGQPADDVLDRGRATRFYFNKQINSQQRWRFKTPEDFTSGRGRHGRDTRYYKLRCLDDLAQVMAMSGNSPSDQWLLVDLIKRMLELDPDRRIKPLEVLQHPFFSDSLSQSSSADSLDTICSEEDKPEVSEQFYSHGTEGPENVDYSVESCVDSYMEITDNAEETTEVTQQSSRNQTAGPENTDCNDDVSYYKTTKKRKRGENTVPEITQQSSLIQTAGPEDTDCNDDVSYYKTTKKRKTGENTVPEVTQQSSWNQTAGPEKIPEISPADILNTVESEEATPVLVNSENSDSSSEMSSGDMSLNMATGINLGECYRVESYLGEGSFGFVSKCCNTETGKMVAIKVNKNHPNVVHQTRGEIAILKKLQCLDPDACNIIKWNGYFFNEDQICLSFELLDMSLQNYMADTYTHSLPMTELRPIIHQLATALSHLRSTGIVHADLKPDNVMIVDRTQQPLRVRLIDFGQARPASAFKRGECVQARWYRAPEVILGLPLNETIDMWALGLLVAEMATGDPLYPGNENYDVLHFIVKTQGQPADDVLDRGRATRFYFNKQNNSQQRWRFKTPEDFTSGRGRHGRDTRYYKLRCLDDLAQVMAMSGNSVSDQWLLVDLIKRMLELDPDRRIKPLEVLQHPFFSDSLSQSSSADSLDTICSEEDKPEVSEQFYSHGTEGPENVDYSVESCVDSYMEITDNAEETTEVTQQSSWNQTAGPENTDCNDDVSYCKTTKKRKRGENIVPEVTQQSSLNQTAGPEDTDCNDDVSYYKTKKKRRKNIDPETMI